MDERKENSKFLTKMSNQHHILSFCHSSSHMNLNSTSWKVSWDALRHSQYSKLFQWSPREYFTKLFKIVRDTPQKFTWDHNGSQHQLNWTFVLTGSRWVTRPGPERSSRPVGLVGPDRGRHGPTPKLTAKKSIPVCFPGVGWGRGGCRVIS